MASHLVDYVCLSMLVLVRSIGHYEVVQEEADAHRIAWNATASEEDILVSDAVILVSDAVDDLAEIGSAIRTQVSDRLQEIHGTTPHRQIADAVNVAVSIGGEILHMTRKYTLTQGAPSILCLSESQYITLSTREELAALRRARARYADVYPSALAGLVFEAERWLRRGMIPTEDAVRLNGAKSEQGCTPVVGLHLAALTKNVAETSARLAAGENPNVSDPAGYAPLHFAAQAGSVEVVAALLSHGAVVDAPNSYGNTPLFVAVFNWLNCDQSGETIAFLRGHGADPLRKNHSGVTPLALSRLITIGDVAQYFADLP
jgi:uncharacterized protein